MMKNKLNETKKYCEFSLSQDSMYSNYMHLIFITTCYEIDINVAFCMFYESSNQIVQSRKIEKHHEKEKI